MTQPLIHSGLSDQEFWDLALKEVLHRIRTALDKKGQARVGLSGGRTPKHLYEQLAQEKLPWDKMTFVVVDERVVPQDHPESNLGMMKLALFDQTPDAKVLSFDTTVPVTEAAEKMARQLIDLSNERAPLFDLLILGSGKDGHVASLFEGDAALNSLEYAAPAHAKGYPTESRLTTTLMALQNSTAALLLLQGEEKRPVLAALKGAAEPKLTALKLLCEKMPVTVLTDLAL